MIVDRPALLFPLVRFHARQIPIWVFNFYLHFTSAHRAAPDAVGRVYVESRLMIVSIYNKVDFIITTGKILGKKIVPAPLVIGLHDVNVIELHSLGTSVSTRVVITVTPLTLISCGHTQVFDEHPHTAKLGPIDIVSTCIIVMMDTMHVYKKTHMDRLFFGACEHTCHHSFLD